jgi:hypothetical protein
MKYLLALLLALAAKPGQVVVTADPPRALTRSYVRIEVRIPNPTPEMYCPEIDVEWPDGTHSIQESDCEPYEAGQEPFVWRRGRWFGVGRHVIYVRARQGKGWLERRLKVDIY